MSGAAGGRLTTMLLSGLAGYGGIQYGMAAERGEAPSFLSVRF